MQIYRPALQPATSFTSLPRPSTVNIPPTSDCLLNQIKRGSKLTFLYTSGLKLLRKILIENGVIITRGYYFDASWKAVCFHVQGV